MKYFWAIISNLIGLWIVIKILSITSSPFERVATSLLVLIYLQVVSSYSMGTLTLTKLAIGLDKYFRHLRKLLKDEPSEWENEVTKETEQKLKGLDNLIIINAVFSVLIFLIVLYTIVTI